MILILVSIATVSVLLSSWNVTFSQPSVRTSSYQRSIDVTDDLMEQVYRMPPLPTFTELLVKSGSDKYRRHHYERYYETWLAPFRHQAGLKFLEIGAKKGKSLKLWSEYFTHPALILGLAYGTNSQGVESKAAHQVNVGVYRGDQSTNETMQYLIEMGPWDVIVDDGSHVPEHMIYSLFSLWKTVSPGGLYVIEDLETNYWQSGMMMYSYQLQGTGISAPASTSAVAKLQQIEHVLARHQIGATELTVMPGDDSICSIEWGMNLVVVRKCSEAYAYPAYQKKMYSMDEMRLWIDRAQATNPVV
jgi:hypothetical protein